MDNHIHLFCLVLQELAAAGLVRVEKANGAPAAEESTFSISVVLITAGVIEACDAQRAPQAHYFRLPWKLALLPRLKSRSQATTLQFHYR